MQSNTTKTYQLPNSGTLNIEYLPYIKNYIVEGSPILVGDVIVNISGEAENGISCDVKYLATPTVGNFKVKLVNTDITNHAKDPMNVEFLYWQSSWKYIVTSYNPVNIDKNPITGEQIAEDTLDTGNYSDGSVTPIKADQTLTSELVTFSYDSNKPEINSTFSIYVPYKYAINGIGVSCLETPNTDGVTYEVRLNNSNNPPVYTGQIERSVLLGESTYNSIDKKSATSSGWLYVKFNKTTPGGKFLFSLNLQKIE